MKVSLCSPSLQSKFPDKCENCSVCKISVALLVSSVWTPRDTSYVVRILREFEWHWGRWEAGSPNSSIAIVVRAVGAMSQSIPWSAKQASEIKDGKGNVHRGTWPKLQDRSRGEWNMDHKSLSLYWVFFPQGEIWKGRVCLAFLFQYLPLHKILLPFIQTIIQFLRFLLNFQKSEWDANQNEPGEGNSMCFTLTAEMFTGNTCATCWFCPGKATP